MVTHIIFIVLSILLVAAVFLTKSKKHSMDHQIRRRSDRTRDHSRD